MKFGQKIFEQVTHGNKSTNLPDCINDLSAPMSIVKQLN
jgi:hypothetical protein